MLDTLGKIGELLGSGQKELYEIIILSLKVSMSAVFIGVLCGIPIAAFLALHNFKGKKIITNLIYTLMGLPPVLAGLIVYLLLSRKGPLGEYQLLFTPQAMILAQVILTIPIIIGLGMVAIKDKSLIYTETALTLGANYQQLIWTIIKEAKPGIVAAVITAFGRAIAEVGAVMLVGGNIAGHTRVMTTAIVMETRQGNYALGLSLGFVLLTIAFLTNLILNHFTRGEF